MDELNSYIEEHQLESIVQAAVKVAVTSRAKDPAKAIADALLAARPAPAADAEPPTFTFFKFPVDPANVFYYSEHSFAMVNLRPIKPGHLLVVPRRVVARLEELTEVEAADLMRTVHKVVSTLKGKLGAAGFSIASQDGPAAGQTVGHVHYHVIAREETPAIVPTTGTSSAHAHHCACATGTTRARRVHDARTTLAQRGTIRLHPLIPRMDTRPDIFPYLSPAILTQMRWRRSNRSSNAWASTSRPSLRWDLT